MRNNCVLFCFGLFVFIGCSTSPFSVKTATSAQVLKNLEDVSWDFNLENVKNRLGEPSDQAFDDKTKTRVIRYLDSNEKNARSRSHLVFEGQPEVLTKKYVNIFDKDPESNLSYWKNKSSPSVLDVRTVTICQGHSIENFQFARLTKSQRIEIENGKVVVFFGKRSLLQMMSQPGV